MGEILLFWEKFLAVLERRLMRMTRASFPSVLSCLFHHKQNGLLKHIIPTTIIDVSMGEKSKKYSKKCSK